MITKDLKRLLQKLNPYTTRVLETAAGFTVSRTHYEVTVEHVLLKLLEEGTGDVPLILRHFGADLSGLEAGLLRALEGMRSGNPGRPAFAPALLQLAEAAWIAASVHHGQDEIRSGNLLEALLETGDMQLAPYAAVLQPVRPEELRQGFQEIVAGSAENTHAGAQAEGAPRGEGTALALYTQDVTGQARAGKVDPVFGRDREVRQMIDILARRRKNNPILVGEPGVGKTAVVEGLALRIANGDVPSSLANVELRSLDLSVLQAGAGVKGEFENRLKAVITEVKESPTPVILFIDEAHTLIGAGGAAGTADAANMLKPALARGELRTIAATTWSEYKKYFEKDAALERRFQMVKVEEPPVEDAVIMLRGIKGKYEEHHGLTITEEAVRTAVVLSDRFISGRQLPDKAVDLLDTAAARVRMSQTARPARLDDLDRQIQNLEIEVSALTRDSSSGIEGAGAGLQALYDRQEELVQARGALEERWQQETALVQQFNDARRDLSRQRLGASGDGQQAGSEGAPAIAEESGTETGDLAANLAALQAQISDLQGEDPLVHADVAAPVVAQVVADWTGIPVGNVVKDEAATLLAFESRLREGIRGQEEAVAEISDILRSAKAGMKNPEAPIATFLFVGPSGVGKTEMARKVAHLLFGGDRFLTTINMSEYQESHTVSQLKGSPPGYVGYGEGGILTEAVRQRPYSVVLLDEVEKAHRDVLNLFYQVFDKGFMRDGEGREIDFRNTVIMMTSNLGSDITMEAVSDEHRPSSDDVREALHGVLAHHFQPALLARMRVVPFYPLSRDAVREIVGLKLGRIGSRLHDAHGMQFVYTDEVVDKIAGQSTQSDLGARNIDAIIEREVMPQASRALLGQMVEGDMPDALHLDLNDEGGFAYSFA